MSLYFNTRIINLGPAVPDVRDNTILYVAEELPGGYIRQMLEDEYGQLQFTRWVEGGEETVGNVADPINVEHGQPMTVAESIRNHTQLAMFLHEKIAAVEFADLEKHRQTWVRRFYKLVFEALHMQKAMADVGAEIIVTVCWS